MTMWEPVALCCFTRRTGCLVLGSLEVIGGAFSLVFGTYLWFEKDIGALNFVCQQLHESSVEDCDKVKQNGAEIAVFCGVVEMVCASIMIHGVRKNEHLLIAPFLIKNVIALVLATILAGLSVVLLCMENFVLGIIAAYMYGALIFMWTYFLLTVRAYYYEMKRAQAADFHKLVEHGVTGDGLPH